MKATEVINLIEEEKITLLNATHFNSDFTPNELQNIKNALITNSSVEVVELENIEIKNNIWQILSESLALNNSIKSLKINNIKNLDNDLSALEEIIIFSTSIEELIIANHINSGNDILNAIGYAITTNTNLKKLVLTNNNLKGSSIDCVSQIINMNNTIIDINISHQRIIKL